MTAHIDGEEWRAMDTTVGLYDPSADEEALSRAEAGIEAHRKRDIALQVVRPDGSPVSGLEVQVALRRHAFPFGDQLWPLDRMHRFNEHATDRGFYWRQRFVEVLNAANALCYWTERPENDGPKIEDVQGRNVAEHFAYCVDWANSQGLIVKGHPLFWSIDKCVPEWVKRYDIATQMKFAEVRVRNLVARFKGRVWLWDAVNEALWEPAPEHLAQRFWPHIEPIPVIADYIEQVLNWVRDENPDARYLINDYGTESDPPKGPPRQADGTPITAAMQRERYVGLVAELAQRGTPPDAIGLQFHTGGWLTPAAQMAVYDAYDGVGVPVHVTEFWASTRHLVAPNTLTPEAIEAMQAAYVVNTLTCAFGHPAVEAFFFWGFMNQAMAWGEASSHHPKLVYHRVRELLREKWMTRVSMTTDEGGWIKLRGFYGDYALRYRLNSGRLHGIPFTLGREHAMPITLVAPFAR